MCHAGRRNKSGIVAVYMALTYPPKNSTPEGDGGRHSSTNAREKIREMEVEKLRQLFRDIDNDGSGTLDRLEVKFLARKLGKKMSTTEVEAAFSEMDPSVRDGVPSIITLAVGSCSLVRIQLTCALTRSTPVIVRWSLLGGW